MAVVQVVGHVVAMQVVGHVVVVQVVGHVVVAQVVGDVVVVQVVGHDVVHVVLLLARLGAAVGVGLMVPGPDADIQVEP